LIVDRYGFLFHLYQWADLAFVGGSFKSKVHSVMEPLSYFKPVCVGPFYQNNREAIEFSQIPLSSNPISIVQSIQNTQELTDLLELFSKMSSAEQEKIRNLLQEQMISRQGATKTVFQTISFLLK
jgi:3-deoxy-D-manno-octulosonic-acid transferase